MEPSCLDMTLWEGLQQSDISLQFCIVCSAALAGSIHMHRLSRDIIDNAWALAGVCAACTQAACSLKPARIQNAHVRNAGLSRTSCHWGSRSCCF